MNASTKGRLVEREAYEFFAGTDDSGAVVWTRNATDRRPVFEDPAGVGWNVSVSYNAGLARYLLATEHGETFAGRLGLFDAPHPWGPWTVVSYASDETPFGHEHVETSTFFWNFVNKWASSDGESFVLLFTGIGANDSWNTVEGRFMVVDSYRVGPFRRGDCNRDGAISDLGDALFVLFFSFFGDPVPGCLASCDADADGHVIGVVDAVYMLNFTYAGGSPPAAPFPACATTVAPASRALTCQATDVDC